MYKFDKIKCGNIRLNNFRKNNIVYTLTFVQVNYSNNFQKNNRHKKCLVFRL